MFKTIKKGDTMKNYKVTLEYLVNASRDVDLKNPEVKQSHFYLGANSKSEAIEQAKGLDVSGLCVWNSYAERQAKMKISYQLCDGYYSKYVGYVVEKFIRESQKKMKAGKGEIVLTIHS